MTKVIVEVQLVEDDNERVLYGPFVNLAVAERFFSEGVRANKFRMSVQFSYVNDPEEHYFYMPLAAVVSHSHFEGRTI